MRAFAYEVVDVFTERPLEGNPLAVFPHALGLDSETMQRIARELNLSETVFVLPSGVPGCCAQLRIFTPVSELPFAGHPTIGAASVIWSQGIADDDAHPITLDLKVGPVPVRRDIDSGLIWLTTPPIRFEEVLDRSQWAQAVGLGEPDLIADPQIVSAGTPFAFVGVADPQTVDRASCSWLPGATPQNGGPAGVFVFAVTPAGAYSRMFAPALGVPEDPATGSATGPLAAYMMRYGLIDDADGLLMVSEQGVKIGRRSEVHVLVRGKGGRDGIEVGGHVASLVQATMSLPS